MLSILLSHSTRDRFLVRKLAERLRAHDVNVCLDEAEISIGDELADQPSRYVCVADSVGVVLSENSVTSNWVTKDLRAALNAEESRRRIVVFPMLFGPVNIPDYLRARPAFDFATPEKLSAEFPRLLEALGVPDPRHPTSDTLPSPLAPVGLPAQAGLAPVALPSTPSTSSRPVPATPASTEPASQWVRRLSDFQDIRITGLSTERTRKRDPEQPSYDFYFPLSAPPPTEWLDVFESERRFSTPPSWRREWFELEYLVVRGAPEDLNSPHFARLQADIARSNLHYRQYFTEIAEREAARRRQAEREQKLIEDMSRRLKFT